MRDKDARRRHATRVKTKGLESQLVLWLVIGVVLIVGLITISALYNSGVFEGLIPDITQLGR